MDDLLAIYVLLRDPTLDVRAIAIDGTGLVHCGPGSRNMRRILGAFERLDIPFGCGRDDAGPERPPFPDEWRGIERQHVRHRPAAGRRPGVPARRVTMLQDAIAVRRARDRSSPRAVDDAPGPVRRPPGTLANVAGIHAMAGAIDVPGNIELDAITPADGVEWNVGADPDCLRGRPGARRPGVLRAARRHERRARPARTSSQTSRPITRPRARTSPTRRTRATRTSPTEGNYWWDATAAVSLTDPSLLTWEDMTVTVDIEGPRPDRPRRRRAPGPASPRARTARASRPRSSPGSAAARPVRSRSRRPARST